jgi:tripartite-type tricarboxylate transporter receptor subunit TctC
MQPEGQKEGTNGAWPLFLFFCRRLFGSTRPNACKLVARPGSRLTGAKEFLSEEMDVTRIPLIKLLRVAAFMALACAAPLCAQTFPIKPLRLVVTLPPGGATDITARIIAAKLGEVMGQTVIVENRPGAGGQIGAEQVAKSAADGYTLLFGGINSHGISPALYKRQPYDPVRDFAPISLASTTPNVLVVHPSVPVTSVAELIAYAKANPGKLDYGSSGIGNSPHLTMELFKSLAGVKLNHVPYKGGGQYVLALLTGEVPVAFDNLPGEIANIRSGKIRALAVTSAKRAPQLPEVPTVAESGLPGFEVTVWFGFFAPAATPRPVLAQLNAAIVKALGAPDLKAKLDQQGAAAAPSTPEELAAFVASELVKWAQVVKDSGASAD